MEYQITPLNEGSTLFYLVTWYELRYRHNNGELTEMFLMKRSYRAVSNKFDGEAN